MSLQEWTGVGTNLWSSAQNWLANTVPANGDVVFIPGGTATEPVLDTSTANLSSLTIDANGTLTVPDTYTLNVAGTAANAIDLIGASTLHVIGGTIADAGGIAVEGTAVLVMDSGTISAAGGIALADGTALIGGGVVAASVTATGAAAIEATGFLELKNPINGSNLVLSTAGSLGNLVLTGSGSSVQSVNLNGGTLTLNSGASLAVTDAMAVGTGLVFLRGGTLTDTLGLTLGNGGSLSGIDGIGVVNAAVSASGTAYITGSPGGTLVVTGKITGFSGLVLSNEGPTGTLRLDAAGSIVKTVALNGGALRLSGGLTVNSLMDVGTGQVNLAGYAATLVDAFGVSIGSGSIYGIGTVNAAVTVTGAATITSNGGTLEMAGPIINPGTLGLDIGVGDLLLDAASAATSATFSSGNTVGTLELNTNASLTLVNALDVGANIVRLDGPAATLTDAAGVTIGAGTISGAGIVAAAVTATGPATIQATGGTLEMSGPITSTGSLVLVVGNAAGDTLLLGDPGPNYGLLDFSASSIEFLGSAGTLELGSNARLAAAISLGANTLQMDGDSSKVTSGVYLDGSTVRGQGTLGSVSDLNASNASTITASGGTLDIGSVQGGQVTLATAAAGDTLRLDFTAQAKSVNLAGGGTLLLGSVYSVATITDQIAIGTGNVVLANAAAALTDDAGLTLGTGVISGLGTINATVDASSNPGAIIADGGTLRMTKAVTGNGLLLGATGVSDVLRLDAAGNTANTLILNGGVLMLGNANASLADSSTTTLGTGTITGLGMFTGEIVDGTALGSIMANGGTLEMAGPVTGSALVLGTTLSTDTLRLDATGNTAGSLTLNGGTLLLDSRDAFDASLAVAATTMLGTGTITGSGTFTGAVDAGASAGTIAANGGTLEMASAVTGSALVLATTTGTDTLRLDVAGNSVRTVTLAGGGRLQLTTNSGLTVAAAMAIGAGTLSLATGATMTDANGVTLAGGTIDGDGGLAAAAGIVGYGTFSANFAPGTDQVTASAGTLKITANIPDSGGLAFNVANSPQSILRFDGSVGGTSTVAFIGTLGALELNDVTSGALNFAGTVYGLDVGNSATLNPATSNYINVQNTITKAVFTDSTHIDLQNGSVDLGSITLGSPEDPGKNSRQNHRRHDTGWLRRFPHPRHLQHPVPRSHHRRARRLPDERRPAGMGRHRVGEPQPAGRGRR